MTDSQSLSFLEPNGVKASVEKVSPWAEMVAIRGRCCGNAVGQLGSPAPGCPIDPPGEDRRPGALHVEESPWRSDRATALVTRRVTRTLGKEAQRLGR